MVDVLHASSMLKCPYHLKPQSSASLKIRCILIRCLLVMEPKLYRHATARQMHSLTVAGTEDVLVEIVGAIVIERRGLSSSHEEADTIIVQHIMTRCMVGEVVSVICDDTDVFALLLHFVAEMKPNGQLCMQSVNVNTSIVPDLIAIYAPTGADTSSATFGIGKTKALKVARTAMLPLHAIVDTQADEAIVFEQATSFILV